MIKVCNVIEEGRLGGPQGRIALVSGALGEFGVQTHVVHPIMDAEKFSKMLDEAGVTHTPLEITRLSRQKGMPGRYVRSFVFDVARLYRFLRDGDFDLVHVNSSHQYKGALAALLAGVPVIWHLNDTLPHLFIKAVFRTIAWACAEGFIFAGKRVYNNYLNGSSLARRPVMEIHAPVDTVLFNPDRASADPGIKGRDGMKVLMLSNINPGKGIDHFINVAEYISDKHPGYEFFIGGPVYESQRQYAEHLQAMVEDKGLKNVTFLGAVDDVPAAIKATDIFVFASVSEASPTVVWEAMAMAKPIVSTDVGSVSQYIEDGVNGYVVGVGDVDSMSARVCALAGNPELRASMGTRARDTACQYLSVSKAALLHLEMYKKVLSMHSDRDINYG